MNAVGLASPEPRQEAARGDMLTDQLPYARDGRRIQQPLGEGMNT